MLPSATGERAAPARFILALRKPGWRNWQTQWTQNPPVATPCEFESRSRHHVATFFRPRASKLLMPRIADIGIPDSVAAAARSGDPQALEAVYRLTAGPIYTLLRRLVRRPAIAEELLQETFVDVLEHIGAFEERCPLAAWIRSIAVNRALMYLRSPWHRSLEWLDADPRHADGLTIEGPKAAAGADGELERALMRLPALSRAVVWLHDVEGYTHIEIGLALGRTPSFSKSQLSRAHARLRDLLRGAASIGEGTPCTPA